MALNEKKRSADALEDDYLLLDAVVEPETEEDVEEKKGETQQKNRRKKLPMKKDLDSTNASTYAQFSNASNFIDFAWKNFLKDHKNFTEIELNDWKNAYKFTGCESPTKRAFIDNQYIYI
jgi:hypothetical protein